MSHKLITLSPSRAGAITTDIQKLKQLQVLFLGRNAITGTIPATVGALSELRELSLHKNQMTGFTLPGTYTRTRRQPLTSETHRIVVVVVTIIPNDQGRSPLQSVDCKNLKKFQFTTTRSAVPYPPN